MSKVKIVLSESRPVTVDPDVWPLVVKVTWFSGQHECQANEEAYISVRQHADGRAIVYGYRDRGPGGMPVKYEGTRAGYRVDAKNGQPDYNEIVRSIRRVAGVIDLDNLGAECVAELEPEAL